METRISNFNLRSDFSCDTRAFRRIEWNQLRYVNDYTHRIYNNSRLTLDVAIKCHEDKLTHVNSIHPNRNYYCFAGNNCYRCANGNVNVNYYDRCYSNYCGYCCYCYANIAVVLYVAHVEQRHVKMSDDSAQDGRNDLNSSRDSLSKTKTTTTHELILCRLWYTLHSKNVEGDYFMLLAVLYRIDQQLCDWYFEHSSKSKIWNEIKGIWNE